jgi:hypothetical protein
MPDDLATRATPGLHMRAAFAPATWNAEARTIDVIWTTGADVTRQDYWTGQRWIERLDVSADAVDLARMNAGAPVLNTHSSYRLGDVVGVVERAWVEGGRGMATLRFSDRPEVAEIVRDVAAGILRNISVGYVVEQWDVTDASKGAAEVRTAKRWTPYEVSLVPIPADAGAQVRAGSPLPPAAPPASKESAMDNPDPAATAAARAAELDAVRATERARVAEIMTAQRQAGLDADWAERHIGAGTSADTARAEALAQVAARATPRVDPAVAGSRQDEGDTQRRLLRNALEHRALVPGVELEQGARQFRGFRMLDFARTSIELGGGSHRGLNAGETFQRAFELARQGRYSRGAGMHATGDFPDLLANTASKSLRASYESAPRTFTRWATRVSLPDFKSFKAVALGGASALAAIGEGGEVTYGTLDDAAETWNIARYGKALAITYVALINDDMSGFSRVPAMFAQAAARLESTTVYAILTANGNMADGNALISAAHANTTTGALTADATGVTNVGKVSALLRVQTAPNGDILGLMPRFLLVPAGKETVANQLFSPATVLNTLGAVNPYRSTMEVIVEPRLDATSAVAFYGVADPSAIDTVHYGYLEGEEGPVLSTDIEFDTDGMKTKVMHNFGAAAIDWRGIAYSTGA